MVERSRRRRDVNDNLNTRMILTTAVFAAVASFLAGPAAAVTPQDPAIGTAFAARDSDRNVRQTLAEKGPIPYLSHGIGVDENQFSGQPSVGLTGDSALKVDRAVAAADEAFDAYRVKSALEARQSLFEDQQPSVGLTGDAALTRDDVSVSSTTLAVSSDDDFDWAWVGIGGGAALLAAAMAGFYFGTRHRGRIALP
jgi:hypothetical protein